MDFCIFHQVVVGFVGTMFFAVSSRLLPGWQSKRSNTQIRARQGAATIRQLAAPENKPPGHAWLIRFQQNKHPSGGRQWAARQSWINLSRENPQIRTIGEAIVLLARVKLHLIQLIRY
ncbi:hypothetical protein VTK73DRAFT_7194 [Phialemonium thermophilum]|uniref:Transposase n=1 Tax=Phialemonium thermophilum TaxID=223376 RepID=A0ABR3WG67_9PEZI